MLIDINPKGRFTYINNISGEKWPAWKTWEELTDTEKEKVNLGIPSDDYIMLDKDLKGLTEEQIYNEWLALKQKLIDNNIKRYIADRSPSGFHVFVPFNNLRDFDIDIAREIRKSYIQKFECDQAKASMAGVISLPQRPHFKTNIIYPVLEITDGTNELNDEIISKAREKVEKIKTIEVKTLTDTEFKNYFETDPFFLYIKSHNISDSQERNNVIFPNLAIACVKSGKTKEEIEAIIKPIIQENFPGKHYAEFDGWLKKAFSGLITDYNLVQLNTWNLKFGNSDILNLYDISPLSLANQLEQENPIPEKKEIIKDDWVISDNDFSLEPDLPIQWIVDGWIGNSDICGIVGKFSSFKTTILLHIIYAISEGKPVFGKYNTIKSRVLYLNEENHRGLYKKMTLKIKKGLDIINAQNVNHIIMKNVSLDRRETILRLIQYINDNKIKLVVFDSFRRFFKGPEDKADTIANIFDILKFIRSSCNDCTIILIHHAKKSAGYDGADERDAARGSSDFGNSLDSEIMFKRKINQNTVLVSHIKNRSGPEISGKIVQIDIDDNKTYVWESGTTDTIERKLSKPEECANKIIELLTQKRIPVFVRSDLQDLETRYCGEAIKRGLKILIDDGILMVNGKLPRLSYVFDLPTKAASPALESVESDDIDTKLFD